MIAQASDESVVPLRETATPLGLLTWTLLGAGSAAVVYTARQLHPDARGFGTHQQLGLPPCEFHRMTGIACPGCGLTTSFAHTSHGELLGAFKSHLMGPSLFAAVLILALFAPYALVRRRPVSVIFHGSSAAMWLGITSVLGLLTWVLRLLHWLPSR